MEKHYRSHTPRSKLIRKSSLVCVLIVFIGFSTFQIFQGLTSGEILVPRHYGPDKFASWMHEPWRFIRTLCFYIIAELFSGLGLVAVWAEFRDAVAVPDEATRRHPIDNGECVRDE